MKKYLIAFALAVIMSLLTVVVVSATDKYFLGGGQTYITNGTGVITESGRIAYVGNTTLNVTQQGTFVFSRCQGATVTLSDGAGCTITGGSPKTISVGTNNVEITGTGVVTLSIGTIIKTGTNSTANWSLTSGGVGGASVPSYESVYVDSKSFYGSSQGMDIEGVLTVTSFNWTGVTNTPNLGYGSGTGTLGVRGNVVFVSGMTITWNRYMSVYGYCELTSAGLILPVLITVSENGTLKLMDNLQNNGGFSLTYGTLNTNNYNYQVNAGYVGNGITISGVNAKTLTLGTSTITTSSFNISGTNVTKTGNCKIVCSANVTTGGIQLYDVLFTGATPHIYGAISSLNTLELTSGTTQTLYVPDGSSIAVTNLKLSGDSGHAHTVRTETSGVMAVLVSNSVLESYVTYEDILRVYSGVVIGTSSGTTGVTFVGGGGSYTSMNIGGTGNYDVTISGNNTIGSITLDTSVASKGIKFPSSGTTMITGILTLGNGGRLNASSSPVDAIVNCLDVDITGSVSVSDIDWVEPSSPAGLYYSRIDKEYVEIGWDEVVGIHQNVIRVSDSEYPDSDDGLLVYAGGDNKVEVYLPEDSPMKKYYSIYSYNGVVYSESALIASYNVEVQAVLNEVAYLYTAIVIIVFVLALWKRNMWLYFVCIWGFLFLMLTVGYGTTYITVIWGVLCLLSATQFIATARNN